MAASLAAWVARGLTFGSISALYGYTHHFIDRTQYAVQHAISRLSSVVTAAGRA